MQKQRTLAGMILEVQILYCRMRRGVPWTSHVYLHVLEHLAVLARNVCASRFVVHPYRGCLSHEHHLQTVLFVRLERQYLGDEVPLSIIVVVPPGVSVYHMKPVSTRPEPHTRDVTVLTAVVIGYRSW